MDEAQLQAALALLPHGAEFRFVDRDNPLHRLRFHQHATFDQHVKAERFFSREAFVFDQHRLLTHAVQATQLKFFDETPFVNGLNQAWPFVSMHFNGGSDDGLGQPRGFFK